LPHSRDIDNAIRFNSGHLAPILPIRDHAWQVTTGTRCYTRAWWRAAQYAQARRVSTRTRPAGGSILVSGGLYNGASIGASEQEYSMHQRRWLHRWLSRRNRHSHHFQDHRRL